MKSAPLLYLIACWLMSTLITHAQFTVMLTTEAATCSSNGSIQVLVDDESGNYIYQLESDCGTQAPPQPSSNFSLLSPCSVYTITVIDQDTNESQSAITAVDGNYQAMEIMGEQEGCNYVLDVMHGTPPYQIGYLDENDNFILNNPSNNPVFSNLENGSITFRVEDACGNTTTHNTNISAENFMGVNYETREGEGIFITPQGGGSPTTIEVITDAGTMTGVNSILIPLDFLECSTTVELSNGCSTYTEEYEISVSGYVDCINISEGTATFIARTGVPPFIYSVFAGGETLSNTDGIFTNLPTDLSVYYFYLEDACGNRDDRIEVTRYEPVINIGQGVCEEDTISFSVKRECRGSRYFPMTVSCLNCEPVEEVIVEDYFSYEGVIFTGFRPGEWVIAFEDDCNEQVICTDEVGLEIQAACDSLISTIIGRFSCDNGTSTRRVIEEENAIFQLFDENNTLIATNESGVFRGLDIGNYQIKAIIPSCDTLTNSAELSDPTPINPSFSTEVYTRTYSNDTCRIRYHLEISKSQGPFILSGPDNYYQVLNDHGDNPCGYYNAYAFPGIYTLTSMSRCGSIEIELPELEFDFTATVISNCPNDAEIELSGGHPRSYWREYFLPYGLNMEWNYTNSGYDKYDIVVDDHRVTSNDPYTFPNLSQGSYITMLRPFHGCAIDTIRVSIPDYEPTQLTVEVPLICDDENSTTLPINVEKGVAPYTLEIIDCDNPSQTLDTYNLDTAGLFLLEQITLGSYCFIVTDNCGNSSDYQTVIRYFTDNIAYHFTCDETLVMEVDSFSAQYEWKDENGLIIGNEYRLAIPAPTVESDWTATISFDNCTIERQIHIPATEIIPNVEIISSRTPVVLCGESDSLLLQASSLTSSDSLIWNTNSNEPEIWVTQNGAYTLTIFNELGCHFTDTLWVETVDLPQVEISGTSQLCEGTQQTLEATDNFSTYDWSTGAISNSLIIQEQGTYSVTVTDNNNCENSDSLVVLSIPNPVAIIQGDSLICPQSMTTLSLNELYDFYEWSDNSTNPTTTVNAGIFHVTITDNNGCVGDTSITIVERPQISIVLSGERAICQGEGSYLDFSITEFSSTDSLNLVLQTDNGLLLNFQNIHPNDSLFIFPSQSTSYTIDRVEVNDYNCHINVSGEGFVEVNELTYQTEIDEPICVGDENGGITVTPNSAYPPYHFQWNTGAIQNQLNNLIAGNYIFTITDQLDCEQTDSIYISNPPVLQPNITALSPLCYGDKNGSLSIDDIVGGAAPYRWSIDELTQHSIPYETTGLEAGVYHLWLKDSLDCPFDTTIILEQAPLLQLELGEDIFVELGDKVEFEPLFNFNDIGSIEWTGPFFLPGENVLLKPEIRPLETNLYQLKMTNEKGCLVEDDITIFVDKTYEIYKPNAFSPNGDGKNDYFTLFAKLGSIETVHHFKIMNRWGGLVFEATNFDFNQPEKGWNGWFKDKTLNIDSFIWTADIQWIDGHREVKKGSFSLMR